LKKKAVIGMSGGVDSSAAAWLLKRQGFFVFGIYFIVCDGSSPGAARQAADQLNIPLYVYDVRDAFKRRVTDFFLGEYLAGRTPNPCVRCNRLVKWAFLLDRMRYFGADYVATGHYADVEYIPETGRYALKRSAAVAKDQTYFLYGLTQAQLAVTLFPLSGMTKGQVRETAAAAGLKSAAKPDSVDICFIPGGDYAAYLENQTGTRTGFFLDTNGNILGEHGGIHRYTAGQRKGLGASFGRRMYVASIDAANNAVVLADECDLYAGGFVCGGVNFVSVDKLAGETEATVKIRYAHKPAAAVITQRGDAVICKFLEKQRAVTPGQSAVFYDNGRVLCGGVIQKTC